MILTLIMLLISSCFGAVFTAKVPPPRNLRIISRNLGLVLEWDRPRASAGINYSYTAEYRSWNTFNAVCQNVSALSCDFTRLVTPYGTYTLRVRAELHGNSSTWKEIPCKPLETITVISAPDVRLRSRAGKLEVDVTEPFLRKSSLTDVYTNVLYRLRYWPEGRTNEMKEKEVGQRRVMLIDLRPVTRYCVEVQIVMDSPNKSSLPSNITCEMTAASDEVPSWLIPVVLVVSCLVSLSFALFMFLTVWGSYRGVRYLNPRTKIPEHFKQYLTERPGSAMLLAMQNSAQPKELCHEFSILTAITAPDLPPESQQKQHSQPT